MHPTDFIFLGLSGQLWLALLLIVGFGLFAYVLWKRWELIRIATRPDDRFHNWPARLVNVLLYFLGQKGIFKERAAGAMHALIFWGFLIYVIRTIELFLIGFNGNLAIPETVIGNIYNIVKEVFIVLVTLAILVAFYRRYILRVPRLTLSWSANSILLMILILMVTDVLIDATSGRSRGNWSPLANIVTVLFAGASPAAIGRWNLSTYWLNIVTNIVFLNFLPISKHFHVITSFFNTLFVRTAPQGRMEKLDVEGAFEREESLGLETIKNLSWKDVFDLYNCTECGRCEANCPAHLSGKVLSPKEIILEIRDQAYEEVPVFGRGREPRKVVGLSVRPEEIWACTTCMACVAACPVQIDQLSKILEMRRNEVMIHDEYPELLGEFFKGMDGRGNPWNMTADQRLEWTKGLDAPVISKLDGAQIEKLDYLFWVGCATAFDPRNQKVARSLVKILQAAGLRFAILGEEESCTGDAARRIGHEYLFQIQAQRNIETLNKYNVKRLLTVCPHCFNTFKNEYPDFGGHYEVVHHTQLISDLIKQGRIRLTKPISATIAYHDSCYLGRYNKVYESPRETIAAIPGAKQVEMKLSRERGMCCGAGGGLMWLEEEPGKRVNELRVAQALEVKAEMIATACPFCMTMLEDGIAAKDEGKLEDRNIAELVAEAMGLEAT